jgi:replicative DNA helicase
MNIDEAHIKSNLYSVVTEIESAYKNDGNQHGNILSGLLHFDELTGGFKPGQLIVIGGRPMTGKSALMNTIIINASVKNNKKSLVFSAEKNIHDLSLSLLGACSNIQPGLIRRGHIHDDKWPNISNAIEALSNSPIYLDNCIKDDIHSLMAKAYEVQEKIGKIDIIFVDYIQLLCRINLSIETRTADLSSITKGLKILACDLNVPVIAFSQLTRNVEHRTERYKYPLLSDFRDSGSIEEDADLVCFLYRHELYDEETPERDVNEIIIAKQRLGPLGKVKATYMPRFNRFDNIEQNECVTEPLLES